MRLATFNLKHGATADGYLGNPEQVAIACADLQADILALQEVDKGLFRSGLADLATLAARESGMEVVFAKTMRMGFGQHGNALLVRGQITEVEELELTGGPRLKLHRGTRRVELGHRPRNAIVANAQIGDRQISVAATHLSTEKAISRRQLPLILAALANRSGPHVLMGDLNRSRREVLADLPRDVMELAEGQPTFPVANPKKSIDHIAVSGLTIYNVETVSFPISDHLALVVDVE